MSSKKRGRGSDRCGSDDDGSTPMSRSPKTPRTPKKKRSPSALAHAGALAPTGPFTYAAGHTMHSTTCDLTAGDVLAICDALESRLGVAVAPDCSSEGGLTLTHPHAPPGSLKTVRFHADGAGGWLRIAPDAWRGVDPSTVVFARRCRVPQPGERWSEVSRLSITLFLKAFHGAPLWTKTELTEVATAFRGRGFQTRRAKELCLESWGEMGALLPPDEESTPPSSATSSVSSAPSAAATPSAPSSPASSSSSAPSPSLPFPTEL